MRRSWCACVTSGSIKILDTPLQTDYKERNFWSLNQWNNRCRDKRRCLALCVHKTTKIVFLSEVSGFSLGISSHGIWLPQLWPRPPWHSLCFSDLRRTKFFHEKITFFEKGKNWSSMSVCVCLRKYYPCFQRLSTHQLLDHSLSLGSQFADGGEHVTPGDKEMFVGL